MSAGLTIFMAMVAVGARIPQDLYEGVLAYQTETGQNDSELLRDALALLVQGETPAPVNLLEKRMKRVAMG